VGARIRAIKKEGKLMRNGIWWKNGGEGGDKWVVIKLYDSA
jgi:hypothetical protein